MTSGESKRQGTSDLADWRDLPASTHLRGDVSVDASTIIEPYRRELSLHCYRLMGSLQDAEDLVQETMLRAWQHFATFKGSASLRTWLYTIATNACLDALKKHKSRTLPMVAYPVNDPLSPSAAATAEVLWLEPFPDSWLAEAAENPEARYTRRESISLAFLTVLQLLPPRQRAIVILSDVLDWHATEVAELLGLSVSAVNSALHRGRVTLAKQYHGNEQREVVRESRIDEATNALLHRYVQAWETDDVDGIVALIKEDATLSMPPIPSWYQGREAVRAILARGPFGLDVSRQWRLYQTRANGQAAFALYRADLSTGCYHAFGVQVIAVDSLAETKQIADMTIFKNAAIVSYFGFPLEIPA